MRKIFTLIAIVFIALSAQAQSGKKIYVWVDGVKTEVQADSVTFVDNTVPDDPNADYVDLGLSVKWAKCNVGASKPEEYGNYYAWGETTTKSDYEESTYTQKSLKTLDASHDAATEVMGSKWRTPTKDEVNELATKCTTVWTTQNGVKGMKVTGPNGNSIFLPAGGYYLGQQKVQAGSYGRYWSSTTNGSGTYNNAISLNFDSRGMGYSNNNRRTYIRTYGYSVRAVLK